MARIVHLGFGNFHRAHQAWYTHHANAAAGSDWKITGVSMTRRDLRDALAPSQGAYTLAERGPDGVACTRISLHDRIFVAADEAERVIDAIASPDTQIVTLTITEKGYHLTRDGALDLGAPGIRSDLTGSQPKTAIGLLAHGLARRAAHGAALTVISCDNLPENGTALRRAVKQFAAAAGLELSGLRTAYPNTMVDRITPATTDAIRAEIDAITGQPDPAPVLTEAFSEWIIEDKFAGPRPEWDKAGAIITQDVAPFEARKLRCLNAAHSALAYAGLLSGHDYVHEAFADPKLRQRIDALWSEAAATLTASIRVSLPEYLAALGDRFAVAGMRHRLDQIAADGSQKMALRIGPLIHPQDPGASPAAIWALSAWIAYLSRSGPSHAAAPDPGGAHLMDLAGAGDIPVLINAALDGVFGAAVGAKMHKAVTGDVMQWLAARP